MSVFLGGMGNFNLHVSRSSFTRGFRKWNKKLGKITLRVLFLQKIDFYFLNKTKINFLKMIHQNMSPFS
jgi:hypothetical protein